MTDRGASPWSIIIHSFLALKGRQNVLLVQYQLMLRLCRPLGAFLLPHHYPGADTPVCVLSSLRDFDKHKDWYWTRFRIEYYCQYLLGTPLGGVSSSFRLSALPWGVWGSVFTSRPPSARCGCKCRVRQAHCATELRWVYTPLSLRRGAGGEAFLSALPDL